MEAMELDTSNSQHLNGSSSYNQDSSSQNGEVNGYSEKKHKDKHKERHKDKDRDKDRHKHKSHKHDKDRERDRDRDREKDKDRHRDKDREKDRSGDKEKSHHKSSHSSSSPEKDRSRHDKDKVKSEHKSSSEKSRSDHHHSSSSRDKDRDKHHKSKHKEKHRDKDTDRDKERSKDKDRDRERERDKERDREKSKNREKKSTSEKEEPRSSYSSEVKPEKVKMELDSPKKENSMSAGSEDDIPLSQRQPMSNRSNDSTVIKMEDDEDEDDVPLVLRSRNSISKPACRPRPNACNDSLDESLLDSSIDHSMESILNSSNNYDNESSFLSHQTVKSNDSEDEDFFTSSRNTNLASRKKSMDSHSKKRKPETESDEDEKPLIQRKKVKTENVKAKKRARPDSDDSDYDTKKKVKPKPKATPVKGSPASANTSPTKKRKGKEEDQEVWRWWEEAPRADGVKWNFLQHKGPVFAPPYEPLPKNVHFKYNGKVMKLSLEAEEVAGFYARFIEHDYSTKEKFNTNFFKDWRKVMTKDERETITDLKKCDFNDINEYYKVKSEERKAMSKEEKLKIKEENEAITAEYGICIVDGHKEKIGNFRIEPPGLFRGRGEHPKMGMLKKRVMPEDVIINCAKKSEWPQAPKGHKWKEVRHDNAVTWLACWTENVQGQQKYVMLNPTSRLKGEKDWMKYEKARELAKSIDIIRENYNNDFKSKEMRVRQRAVAMYFIDKLALRAGNEKDEDQADTVGCCSLRVEHIELHEEKEDKENVVVFDFLGKDSIRYYNEVSVEKRVFKNLKIFMENKKPGDDLFDRLNTAILNKHLSELMEGLTAKVFRTYNASHTLQQQLDELTPENGTVAEKILAYNRANRAVAILCNHQRAVPKSHEKSMENLMTKIQSKKDEIKKVKKELKDLPKRSKEHEKKANALARLQQQLERLELNRTDKEEGKEIALGTSKLNYLDPRISVGWCKKWDIPIEKVYNKTQRAKFRWAIDMADEDYKFD